MAVYAAINKSELDSKQKPERRGRLFKTHLEAMNSIIKDLFIPSQAAHIHLEVSQAARSSSRGESIGSGVRHRFMLEHFANADLVSSLQ